MVIGNSRSMHPSVSHIHSDIICALATAQGGALGLIRVSGAGCMDVVDSLFTPAGNGRPLTGRRGFTVAYGTLHDADGEVVDDVLVSVFRQPRSYTGEDSVEISCHASPYILQTVLRLLCDNGCRMAGPGEYTRRAFMNGRMDLSQAEAVADLIASASVASHRLAMNQMRGGFSRKLSALRDRLLHLTSLMELELDFSDHEELEFADRTELVRLAEEVETNVSGLTDSFRLGNALKNGIPVAIIGETNTGKSTLLNALVGDDKAIVSDIHGTTRDIIEDTVNIGGVTFRFIDTAGIRQTADTVETIGIERSFRAMDKAQIVILLCDMTAPAARFQSFFDKVRPHLERKQVIIALNKCDAATEGVKRKESSSPGSASVSPKSKDKQDALPSFNFQLSTFNCKQLPISAKYGTNLEVLRQALTDLASVPEITSSDVIVTNLRHYEALTQALQSIRRVREGLSSALPTDLVSQDLRECIYHLGSIVGEVTTDEVLGNIFSHFCIGK